MCTSSRSLKRRRVILASKPTRRSTSARVIHFRFPRAQMRVVPAQAVSQQHQAPRLFRCRCNNPKTRDTKHTYIQTNERTTITRPSAGEGQALNTAPRSHGILPDRPSKPLRGPITTIQSIAFSTYPLPSLVLSPPPPLPFCYVHNSIEGMYVSVNQSCCLGICGYYALCCCRLNVSSQTLVYIVLSNLQNCLLSNDSNDWLFEKYSKNLLFDIRTSNMCDCLYLMVLMIGYLENIIKFCCLIGEHQTCPIAFM